MRTCTILDGSSMQVTQPHGATRNQLWLLVEVGYGNFESVLGACCDAQFALTLESLG